LKAIYPTDVAQGAQLALPYYLLPLPDIAISELLRGDLVLITFLNLGRIAVALEKAGLSAHLERDEIRVSGCRNDGRPYLLVGLTRHIHEVLYECLPVSTFVEAAAAMANAAATVPIDDGA
jgi:hypothetical protein